MFEQRMEHLRKNRCEVFLNIILNTKDISFLALLFVEFQTRFKVKARHSDKDFQ